MIWPSHQYLASAAALEQCCKLLSADRLSQMIERAKPHGLDGVGGGSKGGEHDHGRRTCPAAHAAQDLKAVHVRHAQVEQDGIDALRIELSKTGLPRCSKDCVMAVTVSAKLSRGARSSSTISTVAMALRSRTRCHSR